MINVTPSKANHIAIVIALWLFVSTNIFAQIALPTQTLAAKVEEYMIAAMKANRVNDKFSVTNENGNLMTQIEGLPKAPFSAQLTTAFVFDEYDIQLKFIKDDGGKVIQLIGSALWG